MATGSKLASQAAGKLKGAGKALQGYPGIFHHLAGEHAEVSTLMKRVAASSEDSDDRKELFPDIRKNLLAHAHGEEEVFYPQLRTYPELEPLIGRSLEQHKTIEQLLGKLEAGNMATAAWTAQFKQLVEAVESHVELEEKQLFPKAKDLLDGNRAREMEDRYENVEEREKARL